MEDEGFLDKSIADFQVKLWHILVLVGAGAVAAYLIFKKKGPGAATGTPASSGASGLDGYAALGEQIEPLYDGNPIVSKARTYAKQGWTIFKVPTGQENVMSNRERFPVHIVYAAPPGVPLPAQGTPIKI